MKLDALIPDMEHRLLAKYRAFADLVRREAYIGPSGYRRRGAIDRIHAAAEDLHAHDGQTVNGRGQSAKGFWATHWQCRPTCLTCYEQATAHLRPTTFMGMRVVVDPDVPAGTIQFRP